MVFREIGQERKGRAFYWWTPAGSNVVFLRNGRNLDVNLSAARGVRIHFSNVIRVG
jgi:hypothetical protein